MRRQPLFIILAVLYTIAIVIGAVSCGQTIYHQGETPDSQISDDIKVSSVVPNTLEYEFYGDYTITAYVWDGYNMQENIGPANKADIVENNPFMGGYIDPVTCVGYKVHFAADYCSVGDFTIKSPDYAYETAKIRDNGRYYGRNVELALSLDISEDYYSRWQSLEDYDIYYVQSTQFPEISRDNDWRRDTAFIIEKFIMLDENHLLLNEGVWNLLAVRDSHLDEECNYTENPDVVFARQ